LTQSRKKTWENKIKGQKKKKKQSKEDLNRASPNQVAKVGQGGTRLEKNNALSGTPPPHDLMPQDNIDNSTCRR
jgi:hypothetical protein